MKRLLIPGSTVVVALIAGVALAACGSAGGTATTSSAAAPAAGGATVATKQVAGTGDVLVDASGLPLYTNDQETGRTVLCNTACVSFWRPLTVTGAPDGGALADKLGVVTRGDGARQVTFNGKLLYTFSLDKPGRVNGDGASDAFAGQQFTWHVVHADGSTGSAGGGQTTATAVRGY
jgi:predicted lipoprotein with Yx(FWY)xxD motif